MVNPASDDSRLDEEDSARVDHFERSRLNAGVQHDQDVAGYVITPFIKDILARSKRYLGAGYPLHLRGAAGTGKTAMAFRLAQSFNRPIVFLSGDASLSRESLLGHYGGSEIKRTYDQYISSVKKLHLETRQTWQNEALATACLEGSTLIYDEFNRSTADANNVLLPILQEGIIPLPDSRTGGGVVRVHPEFRAIFTSNNADYTGTHQTQDALTDRMITMDLDYFDEDSEIAILLSKTGLDADDATGIVRAVRDYRQSGAYVATPTMRASLMIGDIAARCAMDVSVTNGDFVDLCLDVLVSKATHQCGDQSREDYITVLKDLIALHCP